MEGENMTKKERKVVVAVDESEESMYALSWCLNNLISHYSSNTLVLLYVKPPPPPVYPPLDAAGLGLARLAPGPALFTGYLFSKDVVAAVERCGRDLVNSVMARAEAVYRELGININVEKKVGTGDAKDVICGTVDKLGADILVMGSHGYGFLKRALLGSVSDHCAKNVKCPVLVIKRPQN